MPAAHTSDEKFNPQFIDRTIRVFVSSTFKDMHAERDYLVKFTFPQLRKLCEERGVTWTDIDLRWGVTDEQAAEGKVLPVCLEEIKRCKPYFIVLLGERYGWIPHNIPKELFYREPWLKEYEGKKSVTELEILHGVLRNPETAGHAFFYLRSPLFVNTILPDKKADFICEDEASKQKLHDLKRSIIRSGQPVRDGFVSTEELGQMVLNDFKNVIDKIYPERLQPGYFDQERVAHEVYAKSRAQVYIGRKEYFERLDEHSKATYSAPLVITGQSGSGKSALLANWAVRYKQRNPDAIIIQHYIGTSRNSANCTAMLRRLIEELKSRLNLPGEIPKTAETLIQEFSNWLDIASRKQRIILIIDAVNQLDQTVGAHELYWLPHKIQHNVRLFISALQGEALTECRNRNWPAYKIQPLEIPEREKLIKEYLQKYAKQLSTAQLSVIASAKPTANPLYLKALLDELKVFGVHEELDKRIRKYIEAVDPAGLYEKIIARWEKDYETDNDLVGDALSLIWAARHGLSETELLFALGTKWEPMPRSKWSPLYLAMAGCLLNRSGLLNFAHNYVRIAVENTYLPTIEHQKAAHQKLASYFGSEKGLSPRKVTELPWQLYKANEKDKLKDFLLDINMFSLLFENNNEIELRGYWIWLSEERDMGKLYLQSFENWNFDKNETAEVADTANKLSVFLKNASLYAEAELLSGLALKIDEKIYGHDHPRVAAHLSNLAQSLKETNRLLEAEPLIRRALDIIEQSFGKEHTENCPYINNLAKLLKETGRHDEAEILLRRALQIAEQSYGEYDDKVARHLNSLADLLWFISRSGEAEPLIRRALEIDEQNYGRNHPNVSKDLVTLALVLEDSNLFSEAELCLRRALSIDEESYGKSHPLVAVTLHNLAQLLRKVGKFAEAEPILFRALNILEQSLGENHPKVSIALTGLAHLFYSTGRLAESEPMLRRALEIDQRNFGKDHPEVATSFKVLALLLKRIGKLSEAEQLMQTALLILLKVSIEKQQILEELKEVANDYTSILAAMGWNQEQCLARLRELAPELVWV